METVAPLRCQAGLLGCVDTIAYRHADPGMAAPVYYCYACLPTELRTRARQLVYEAPNPPRALVEAVAAPSVVLELPPTVVAGTAGRRVSAERMPRMKPSSPLGPAPRVHHAVLPTPDPPQKHTRPDPRVPEPKRPKPPAPPRKSRKR